MTIQLFSRLQWRILFLSLCALILLAISLRFYLPSGAQGGANCSAPYLIDETLANGAHWQLCWEQRNLDGVVLRDVHFTPPGGTQQRILSQASISQVHVPYDDGSARFHDITDDGFGNENLNDLTPEECPDGTLLKDGAKDAVCQQIQSRSFAFKGLGQQAEGELLSLFSVSTSGEYNYIPVWRFLDDGSIEMIMGATGKLQRFITDSRFGWPVRADSTHATSHIHNYYWRLDFDLGEAGDDDIVEEFNAVVEGTQRKLGVTQLATETGRSIAPRQMRSWRIRDGVLANADGRAISYHLEPIEVGHRDEGPVYEPWTTHDFYVTKYNACEKYVSHNPRINCGGHLGAFVNGEALTDADPVLWYGVTFHHVPRDEDEPYMHAHWDGFRLVPRDWMAAHPSAATVTSCAVGDVNCDEQLDAADALFMLQYDVQLRTNSAQIPPPQGTLYGYSCDISGEGRCDHVDALLALQCSVGLANAFCPTAGEQQLTGAIQANNAPAQITLDHVSPGIADKSGEITQSVTLQLKPQTPIGAFSLRFHYDPMLLDGVTCRSTTQNQLAANVCHVNSETGEVRFSGLSAQGTQQQVDLGTISFQWRTAETSAMPFVPEQLAVVNPQGASVTTQIDSNISNQIYLPVIVH